MQAKSTRSSDYAAFLQTKRHMAPTVGRDIPLDALHPSLFPFQAALTRWAIRKGRAGIFAAPGLGKTFMQLEWAKHAVEGIKNSPNAPRCLIVAPLAVAEQTVAEGERWGIPAIYRRSPHDLPDRGIVVTTYEMSEHFDAALFGAVVLDESSILKSQDGKTRARLIKQFSRTPLRLCCTATPAPNDIAEIANHAEFLGVMSRGEMLATFFVHDEQNWRLKKHAAQHFYRWLASWGMTLNAPSDLGYPNDGYDLPPLEIVPELIDTDWAPPGQLFPTALKGITERSAVRKDTAEARVARAAEIIAAEPSEQWLAWCGLNSESDALTALIPDATNVQGSDSPDSKAERLLAFARGEQRVLVSKVSIAGFGLNLQGCARMVFVGMSDSYESYYQAIRRCWRFGQQRPVRAHIVLTTPEEAIYQNVLRKEREAQTMGRELIAQVAEFERAEIGAIREQDDYSADTPMRLPAWLERAG